MSTPHFNYFDVAIVVGTNISFSQPSYIIADRSLWSRSSISTSSADSRNLIYLISFFIQPFYFSRALIRGDCAASNAARD